MLVYKEIRADKSRELSGDIDELDPRHPGRGVRLSDELGPCRGI